jgi:hypothetical protein
VVGAPPVVGSDGRLVRAGELVALLPVGRGVVVLPEVPLVEGVLRDVVVSSEVVSVAVSVVVGGTVLVGATVPGATGCCTPVSLPVVVVPVGGGLTFR